MNALRGCYYETECGVKQTPSCEVEVYTIRNVPSMRGLNHTSDQYSVRVKMSVTCQDHFPLLPFRIRWKMQKTFSQPRTSELVAGPYSHLLNQIHKSSLTSTVEGYVASS